MDLQDLLRRAVESGAPRRRPAD